METRFGFLVTSFLDFNTRMFSALPAKKCNAPEANVMHIP